jgi:putative heme-binding domain-containing protein
MDQLVDVARSENQPVDARCSALDSLVAVRPPGLALLLQSLLRDRDVAAHAIQGLAAFDHPQTPDLLIENYDRLDRHGQPAAIATLTARPSYARRLLQAVAEGQIDRRDVPLFSLRQMQLFGDESINRQVYQLWPELRLIADDKLQRIITYRTQLTRDKISEADVARGRLLFEQNCGKCHRLFGEGGSIGPELTGAQRSNLNYLLENIVDPSATLVEDFRLSVLELDDGRVVSGVILEQTDRTVSVQTATEKLSLPRQSILRSRLSDLSLMPDGLLDVMTDDQVRDLLAYLMSP